MIPVQEQSEPAQFDQQVRTPGLQFLNRVGGTVAGSRLPNYWRRIRNELHGAYGGICAYTCMYLAGSWTVDHFTPKSTDCWLAYEWSNYRLASERANHWKANHTGILDPFEIQSKWFALRFPSCLVVPGAALPSSRVPVANRTIDILKLNADDALVQERCNVIVYLRDGLIQLGFLEQRYPFIADELKRQNLLEGLRSIFRGVT